MFFAYSIRESKDGSPTLCLMWQDLLGYNGDSVVMKVEKARSALEDGLRRVEDIVPQTIGCQVIRGKEYLGSIYVKNNEPIFVVVTSRKRDL
nr:U-box domain-containing protein 45-like [Tanacetum cinerariifolium]